MKERKKVALGDLEVDLEARRVSRNGEAIQLGRLSFDLLETLVRAAPAAVSSEDIVEAVWSGDFVSDETVKQRVSLLRRALGEAPRGEYVETLRGFGYRLGAESGPAEPAASTAVLETAHSGRLVRGIILVLVIISLILVIAVLATAVRQVKRMSDALDGPLDDQLVVLAERSSPERQAYAPARALSQEHGPRFRAVAQQESGFRRSEAIGPERAAERPLRG